MVNKLKNKKNKYISLINKNLFIELNNKLLYAINKIRLLAVVVSDISDKELTCNLNTGQTVQLTSKAVE